MHTTSSTTQSIAPVRLFRWGLASLGIVFVGIGALGVFVPGLPTTVFLIAAIWCFTRSCPVLEAVLIRNKLFAPFLRYIDRTEPIPVRTKAAAIATMWAFVAFAIVLFLLRDGIPDWAAAPVGAAACLGTVAIVRWDAGVRRA